MRRDPVSLGQRGVPVLKANVDFPVLPAGRQLLVFTPERMLVFEGREAGAVAYQDLQVDVSQVRFVEGETLPRDAKVVDRTWRYVNEEGGADRRFKANPEIPVVLYEQIHFQSATGLNELFQVSRLGTGAPLEESFRALASELREAKAA